MARVTTTAALVIALVPMAAAQTQAPPEPSPVLVFYDFEEPEPSGPDTFRLFERAGGSVDLGNAFHVSGNRSLRLQEGADDGHFSEFLGFFPERTEGYVFVQFYILFADPEETFNFALAGPRWFLNFERDGHALWLATRDGKLRHRPKGDWQDLLAPRAFTWYFIDLVYDVDAGTYALAIYEEGLEEAVVDIVSQRNTADANRSSVAYYSFIGDLEDQDRVQFFVDDLLIATEPDVLLEPFVAPGRRRFFVDSYAAYWPPLDPADLETLLFEAHRDLGSSETVDGWSHERLNRLERAGDHAFAARDLPVAEQIYRRLEFTADRDTRILLKMADLHFLNGNLTLERAARERIYGRLELEERKARQP